VEVSFSEQIMPIFEAHCTECHGATSAELGLNLTTYESAMAGSDYGTVIEPGNPDGSLIIDMISSGDMPQDADPMPAEQLDLIRTWISEGALNN
jgi:mono/diheme cytochrome c family protein